MSAIFDSNSPYGAYNSNPYGTASTSSSGVRGGARGGPGGGGGGPGYGASPYGPGSGIIEADVPADAFGSGDAPGNRRMVAQGPWWTAFGTGGFPDEPGLMEELGIDLGHIKDRCLTVLNPFHSYSANRSKDMHMMDDADLGGPLLFMFAFAMLLLLAGKSEFGYIYGVAAVGDVSIYMLLNLMSEGGIDAYRVASVLGYCILPLCLLSAISIVVNLHSILGFFLTPIFILWCSSSASGIFVSVLQLNDQRVLIAYPLILLYSSFAILSVFSNEDLSSARGK